MEKNRRGQELGAMGREREQKEMLGPAILLTSCPFRIC